MSNSQIESSMNPFTLLMKSNPYPTYDKWRAENPILWSPDITAYLVTGHDAAKQILDDHDTFSSGNSLYGGPEKDHREIPQIIAMDGERHKRLRGLVTNAFNWRNLDANLGPRAELIAHNLFIPVRSNEPFDFIEKFAAPLPIMVIAEMLGIDASPGKIKEYRDMTDGLANCLGVPTMTQSLYEPGLSKDQIMTRRYADGNFDARIGDFFFAEVQQRWENPSDDLIGKLIKAEVDGKKLKQLDVVAFCSLLFVAGNLTTTSMIGTMGYVLAQDPEQLETLRKNIEDRDYVKRFTQETIRLEGPGQSSYRKATRDTVLNGINIREGDNLLVIYGAANNDPTVFPSPRKFDPGRSNLNHHLAFGGGIHYCLGAALAHLEGAVSLRQIVQKFDTLEISSGYSPTWRSSPFFQGLTELKLEGRARWEYR